MSLFDAKIAGYLLSPSDPPDSMESLLERCTTGPDHVLARRERRKWLEGREGRKAKTNMERESINKHVSAIIKWERDIERDNVASIMVTVPLSSVIGQIQD